eukprot:CAMPEP_0174729726 /NCGR_PEP_ID=MMETSP1094-20130205/54263_1 /TAXON_ID=156173 /ORGANISM="Chrysochromulina brevifilum, Strain UTEX LB 985" /LENGTH=227 /DNA_ID=CAMNT_0015931885 /DNA_START=53 /DNA_END=736 /DNA_ORIENTATION=+
MAASDTDYFSPNSTDELLASNLRDGDVILIGKRCSSLPLFQAALCIASKYGISADGRNGWDHAAMVYRDRASNVPYLLEGHASGVSLRTFEERLLQGKDHQELLLLPLQGLDRDVTQRGHRAKLGQFVQSLGLSRTQDGFDGEGSCCVNTWRTYRELRSSVRVRGAVTEGERSTPCRFGAPLVASALQDLGALDQRVDAASVTPAALPTLNLQGAAMFGKPVPLRQF